MHINWNSNDSLNRMCYNELAKGISGAFILPTNGRCLRQAPIPLARIGKSVDSGPLFWRIKMPYKVMPLELRCRGLRWHICHAPRQIKTLEELFWRGVVKGDPDNCWDWSKGKNEQGYGNIGSHHKQIKAHRASWIIHFGDIPDGMCVCHKCDNPSCCNPNHLFLGTKLDNVRDMIAKGRKRPAKGESNGRALLTWNQVREIRTLHQQGMMAKDLIKLYPVSIGTIWAIFENLVWQE